MLISTGPLFAALRLLSYVKGDCVLTRVFRFTLAGYFLFSSGKRVDHRKLRIRVGGPLGNMVVAWHGLLNLTTVNAMLGDW